MSFWESHLSPKEAKYYAQLFQIASKSQEGIVTGSEAVQFFATSGVPTQILSEIWEAADRDKVGYLTPETFTIALKLIACAQHGKEASANIIATDVPLPQFDGATIVVPSPIVSNTTINNSANAPITDAEREKYANIFRVHQPVNGVLDAETAKNIFLKSKLPMDVLSQIWYLADVRQSGTLNQAEFIIAMHYIAKLMDGSLTNLPEKLPPAVFQSANGSSTPLTRNLTIQSPSLHSTRQSIMTPPQRARTIDSLGSLAFGPSAPIHEPIQQWDVTAQEKQQFDAYFDKIDSVKSGLIQGKEAVEFFKNSRLPETDLAHIWDLADIQQRGALSRDEFAVAMHLIHQKLAGKPLPQALPKTLVPPSQQQSQPQPSPFSNANAVAPSPSIFASPAIQSNRSLIDDSNTNDLLGDFGDEKVSHETNQVNLMQNQISSLSSQTQHIGQQKQSAESTLEQLASQKRELEAQLTNVRMTHESAVKDLNELQETVRREEGEWDRVRAEYDAAQQQLNTVQNEIAQAKQTLENGRAETESLRRRVHEIQEETRQASQELEKMRAQAKQQSMMLDINKRQVTAAEQDRAQARRHLEDYKLAGGLDRDDDDSSDDDEHPRAEDVTEKAPSLKSPEVQSSVVSTPALNHLFPESPMNKAAASPFTDFKPSSPFDAAFSPALASATNKAPEDDFDAIFGPMATTPSTNNDTSFNAFDSVSWASPSITSPTTKTSRGPPPPPPQSRHHRQTSEVNSIASVTSPSLTSSSSIKKARAPPPPPPSTTTPISAVSPATPVAPTSMSAVTPAAPATPSVPATESSVPTTPNVANEVNYPSEEKDDDDDFEAAFSGNLQAAKVVAKEDDFADFDDAFGSFDQKPNTNTSSTAEKQSLPTTATNNDTNWASNFGGFDFPAEASKPANTNASAATNDDEWDSIFGTTTTAASKDSQVAAGSAPDTTAADKGFDDAFASFGDDFGKQQPTQQKPATNNNIGIMGDKIEELIKMGFAETEAKEALNRYDQDLEKASNFLLDQSSKQ